MWNELRDRKFSLPGLPRTSPKLDPARVAVVKKLFDQHGAEIFLVLACYSLPSAYGAAKGARVLGRSRYLLDDPIRRLCETAAFVMKVMRGPQGDGVESARHVRMIHATLRELMRKSRSEPWDTKTLGVPLNQEDLLGTLMTFSWVVLDGLHKLGVADAADPATRDAVIYVWGAIGLELGILPELLPADFREAEQLTRTIQARQIVPRVPNPVGRKLTQALLKQMEKQLPLRWFDPFVSCVMRFFLPPDVADGLGVPRRLGIDELTGLGLGFGVTQRLFAGIMRDWGIALVEQVMRENDPCGRLVRVPQALVANWWQPVRATRRTYRTEIQRRRKSCTSRPR